MSHLSDVGRHVGASCPHAHSSPILVSPSHHTLTSHIPVTAHLLSSTFYALPTNGQADGHGRTISENTENIWKKTIDASIFKDFQLFSEWQKTNVNQDPLGLIMSSRAPQGLPALPGQLSQGLRRTSQGYPETPRFPPASHGVLRPSNAHSGLPNASQTSQGDPVLPRASQSQKIFENL